MLLFILLVAGRLEIDLSLDDYGKEIINLQPSGKYLMEDDKF